MNFRLTNEEGYPYAFMEWVTVDHGGHWQDQGQYLYIADLWIHPNYRRRFRNVLYQLINMLDDSPLCSNVKFIYWNFEKRDYKLSHLYRRSFFTKRSRNERYISENLSVPI